MTKQCKLTVLKLNQYFNGTKKFIIVDESKRGQDMYHVKESFNSRKEANKFVKGKC